jgi:hypothetical protein
MPPHLLGEMQRLNPLSPTKNRKLRHHQLLSREGRRELERMMIQIVATMKVSQSWEEVVSMWDVVCPVPNDLTVVSPVAWVRSGEAPV